MLYVNTLKNNPNIYCLLILLVFVSQVFFGLHVNNQHIKICEKDNKRLDLEVKGTIKSSSAPWDWMGQLVTYLWEKKQINGYFSLLGNRTIKSHWAVFLWKTQLYDPSPQTCLIGRRQGRRQKGDRSSSPSRCLHAPSPTVLHHLPWATFSQSRSLHLSCLLQEVSKAGWSMVAAYAEETQVLLLGKPAHDLSLCAQTFYRVVSKPRAGRVCRSCLPCFP